MARELSTLWRVELRQIQAGSHVLSTIPALRPRSGEQQMDVLLTGVKR